VVQPFKHYNLWLELLPHIKRWSYKFLRKKGWELDAILITAQPLPLMGKGIDYVE